MEEITLEVQTRNQTGRRKVKEVRREDFVPGIVYGGDQDPTTIKVDRRAYERIMRHHQGQSMLFHLNVMEEGKKLRDYSAIVKQEQHDPVSDMITHIDFNRVSLDEEIEVKVPVETKGEAAGVKQGGGSVDHALWELDIICLPRSIPEKLVVDISALEIGDAIHVKDLVLPEGVRTEHDPDSILVSVVPPMREEPETPAEGEPAEPEVIGEKKTETKAEEKAPAEKAEKPAEKKPEAK